MFTHLRKIRHCLIRSGSMQKYFFYALGEILLVMAGILLALQVNNWNEDRKTKLLEKSTLLELKKSLQVDQERLSFTVSLFDEMLRLSNGVEENYHKNGFIDNAHLDTVGTLFGLPIMQFNRSGYKLLEDRGLDLLSNDSLRSVITSYYETDISMIEYFFNEVNEYLTDFKYWIRDNYYASGMINPYLPEYKPYSYESIKDHERIIGNLKHFKWGTKFVKERMNHLIDQTKKINDLIDTELMVK